MSDHPLAFELLLKQMQQDSTRQPASEPQDRLRTLLPALLFWCVGWSLTWLAAAAARVELGAGVVRYGSALYFWPEALLVVIPAAHWVQSAAQHYGHSTRRRWALRSFLLVRFSSVYLLYVAVSCVAVDVELRGRALGFFMTHGLALAVGAPVIALLYHGSSAGSTGDAALYAGYRLKSRSDIEGASGDACRKHLSALRSTEQQP